MQAFLSSLFFIAAAEMGDKTQLVALAFAARYRARDVLGGVFVATLLVHLLSVAIGEGLGAVIPAAYMKIAAGLAFLGFAVWTLRGDALDEGDEKPARFGPFLTVAIAFFLAELGDKTMLATVTLASQYKAFAAVWLGSTVGMVLADGLAVGVGLALGRRLPEKALRRAAAAVFVVFGILTLIDGARQL
jgi:putative Ca2+/H+ antiporter (TMEM165/GDT1 family)